MAAVSNFKVLGLLCSQPLPPVQTTIDPPTVSCYCSNNRFIRNEAPSISLSYIRDGHKQDLLSIKNRQRPKTFDLSSSKNFFFTNWGRLSYCFHRFFMHVWLLANCIMRLLEKMCYKDTQSLTVRKGMHKEMTSTLRKSLVGVKPVYACISRIIFG